MCQSSISNRLIGHNKISSLVLKQMKGGSRLNSLLVYT